MGIFETLKSMASVLREADKIELYQQILGVMEKLSEMQDKLEKLEAENNSLKERLKIKNDLKYLHNAYWLESNNDGPFCTRCWDKHNQLIRLKDEKPFLKCPECSNSFEGPDIESYRQHLRNLSRRCSSY